jgi:hypothetical protein
VKPDPRPLLTPEMREALAISERLQAELRDPPADPIVRAAYAHERCYWNEVPVELESVGDRTVTLAGILPASVTTVPGPGLPRRS